MTIQRVLTGFIAATILAMAMVTTASAQDRRVLIVNNTGFTMVEFYGSNTGSDSWEEDILGFDVLPSGTSVSINFDDGTRLLSVRFQSCL